MGFFSSARRFLCIAMIGFIHGTHERFISTESQFSSHAISPVSGPLLADWGLLIVHSSLATKPIPNLSQKMLADWSVSAWWWPPSSGLPPLQSLVYYRIYSSLSCKFLVDWSFGLSDRW